MFRFRLVAVLATVCLSASCTLFSPVSYEKLNAMSTSELREFCDEEARRSAMSCSEPDGPFAESAASGCTHGRWVARENLRNCQNILNFRYERDRREREEEFEDDW